MSLNVQIWSNVQVYAQSNAAAAQAITGITKGAPGVVTYVGADPINGDYIALTDVVGMNELDGRIFRVANVNAGSNTLELEGEDTSAYTTFISGNLQVLTFGTQMVSATDVNASGGDFEYEDTTTIHVQVRTQIPTVAAPSKLAFVNIWDPADPALIALERASQLKTKLGLHIAFASGYRVLAFGYVGATLLPGGTAQGKVTTGVEMTLHGRPKYYTT